MFSKTNIIFGLTIFLTFSTVLLMIAVTCVALYARRLRKKIEADFFSDPELVSKVTVRKRNKYTPSVHRKDENELSFYESPPLTDAQKERMKENQNTNQNEDGEMVLSLAKKKTKLSATDSYIEVVGDDQGVTPDYISVHNKESRQDDVEALYDEFMPDEDQYDDLVLDGETKRKKSRQEDNGNERNGDVFDEDLSRNPAPLRPNQATPHQESQIRSYPNTLPRLSDSTKETQQDDRQMSNGQKPPVPIKKSSPSDVTQPHDPVTQLASLLKLPNSKVQCQKSPTTSKSPYNQRPIPSPKTSKSRVTQQLPSRNASNISAVSQVENIGYEEHDSDELYGNQEVINEVRKRSMDNTGIPTPSDDNLKSDKIYGNQVIIDDQQSSNPVFTSETGNPTYNGNHEQINGNQHFYQENQQVYENYVEGELYENYNVDNSSC